MTATGRGHALTAHGNLDRLVLTNFAGFSDAKLSVSFRDIRILKGQPARFSGLRLRRPTKRIAGPPLFEAVGLRRAAIPDLLAAILRLTLPSGFGPFVDKLTALGHVLDAAPSASAQGSSSPPLSTP